MARRERTISIPRCGCDTKAAEDGEKRLLFGDVKETILTTMVNPKKLEMASEAKV